MAGINPPYKFKDYIELASFAQQMDNLDDMIQLVEEENNKLDEPLQKDDLKRLLNGISTSIRQRVNVYDPEKLDTILKNTEVPVEKEDRIEPALQFAVDNLIKYSISEAEIFIKSHVKKHFEISDTLCSTIFRAFKNKQKVYQQNEKEKLLEESSEDVTQGDKISEYPERIIKPANEILERGDSFNFILKTWNKLHVGDKNIGEHLLCSIAGTMILNTRLGLHMKPSGATGTGKSDAMESMLDLLPESKYISGSLSSKVLFYDESLKIGTIVYTDDAKVEGDIITTLRALTSNYQKETLHRTLNSDLKINVLRIPPRVTIWMSSVDSIQDEQLQTRFCLGDTDESETQDERVNKNQKKRATTVYSPDKDDDILTCQCIFDMILQKECPVYAPLVDAIEWNDKSHRRNFDKFLDMLFSVTLYNYKQRKNVYDGIVSTLDDFDRAVKIYNGTAANNACNLNGKEMKIMKCIQNIQGRTITFTELQEKTGIKETNLRYTMNGRNGNEGLLGKVKGLFKVDKTESIGSADGTVRTNTKNTVYRYTGDLFEVNSKLFQSVATINREKAERLTQEFISAEQDNHNSSHTSHTAITKAVREKTNYIKDYDNNNNTIITKNRKKEEENSHTIHPVDFHTINDYENSCDSI